MSYLAMAEIQRSKARYFRGIDTKDTALVRSILADDCVLDYRGSGVDPRTGQDILPDTSIVIEGAASFSTEAGFVVTSVHQVFNFDIELTSETTANSICAMTDRLYLAPGGRFAVVVGYGYYHETYEKVGEVWKIKTLRLQRIRVEGRAA